MKLALKNFKCWIDKEVEFQPGITLIEGPSGIGKSSILQAIYYSLTGKGGISHYQSETSNSCSVQLITPEFKLNRLKRPNRLYIQSCTNQEKYQGDEAQQWITRIYGSHLNETCYIPQKNLASFLFLTPSDKIKLLEDMIDSKGQIKQFKQILKQEWDTHTKRMTECSYQVELKQELVHHWKTNVSGFDRSHKYKDLETIESCQKKREIWKIKQLNDTKRLNQCSIRIKKINNQIKNESIRIQTRTSIQDQIAIQEQQLLTIGYLDNTVPRKQVSLSEWKIKESNVKNQWIKCIQNNELRKQLLNRQSEIQDRMNRISLELSSIREIQDSVSNTCPQKLSRQELKTGIQWYTDYNNWNREQVQRRIYSIHPLLWKPYSKETCLEFLSMIKQSPRTKQQIIQFNQWITSQCKQYSWLQSCSGNAGILAHIQSRIQQYKTRLNAYVGTCITCHVPVTCPNCSNRDCLDSKDPKLIDQKNQFIKHIQQLELFQHSFEIKYNEYRNHQYIIQLIQSSFSWQEYYNQNNLYESQIRILNQSCTYNQPDLLARPLLSLDELQIQLEDLMENHDKLENYELLTLEYTRLKNEENEIGVKISETESVSEKIGLNSNQLEKYLGQIQSIISIHNKIQELNIRLDSISSGPDSTPSLDELESRLKQEELQRQVIQDELIEIPCRFNWLQEQEKYLLSIQSLEHAQSELKTIQHEWEIEKQTCIEYETLFQSCHEAESKLMEQTLFSFQTIMQKYLCDFFDTNIQLECRIMNRTGKNQPLIIITLIQHGMECDIKQLSGGEMDRIQLACTLTFSELFPCPLLMLDESLSSLDSNCCEQVLNHLKQLPQKYILVIAHQMVHGIFDHVTMVSSHIDSVNSTSP